jgi:hypothetical protein
MSTSCKHEFGSYEATDLTGIYDDNFAFQSVEDMVNY